jgi:endonuclease/exonuclease/phosphatase family metal-dependent hydrolase
MRLVAWNTNHNGRRRSLEENVRLLEPLGADILVLSEVARPRPDNPSGAHWCGDGAPGLSVVAPTGLSLTPFPENAGAPPLAAAYRVTGRIAFDLLAVWPVHIRGWRSYHKILMAMLDRFAPLFGSDQLVLAGDLNTNTRVSRQQRSHPLFVEKLTSLGMVSAYHELTGEHHGRESVATYRHGNRKGSRFHIDYCFVPRSLLGDTKLEIRNSEEWSSRSDHDPLVLDIPDHALRSLCGPPEQVGSASTPLRRDAGSMGNPST